MTSLSQNLDIVVFGASAGGVTALREIVQALPQDLDAAVFVVLHIHPKYKSLLAPVLAQHSAISVQAAVDGDSIRPGRVYVAPPDRHLTLVSERVRVTLAPLQTRYRPSIDVLFGSAALAFGPRVIGVVLTGLLNDGTAGLKSVKDFGGISIVQDPSTATFPSMPESALLNVAVDHCVALKHIPELIVRLTTRAQSKLRPERHTGTRG